MALIACNECSREISDTAHACPGCGAPVSSPKGGFRPTQSHHEPQRIPSLPLFLGNVFLPFIFVWFLLRKGYSTRARVIGFGWLAVYFLWPSFTSNTTNTYTSSSTSSSYSAAPAVESHPESTATYSQVNAQVGCKSTYSDQKKDDIFNAQYKDHWMTWSGKIVLLESDSVSLNVDGIGTQDLQVDFADKNAGYDLAKGEQLKVRFLMKSAGGCFLPFGGKQATVVR